MRLKFSIGVAGTHGKTTTTSMIGRILQHANLMPTLIVGGVVAAPFAALVTKHLPDKILMIIVGTAIALLSLRTILIALQ